MTSGEPRTADFATIVDWLEGRVDAATGAWLKRLVEAAEPEVLATVAWWRRFNAAVEMPTEPVPDELSARLRAMVPTSGSEAAPSSSWLNRFMGVMQATLSFDSLRAPGLVMARSSSDATRQLVFSSPGLDVAIDLSELRGDQLTATAQLLPLDERADAGNVLLQTWCSSGLVREGRSDALGRVEMGMLPADVIVMNIDATSAWPAVQAELDLRRSG